MTIAPKLEKTILTKYVDEKLKIETIAKSLQTSKRIVIEVLNKHKIKRRSPSEYQKLLAQPDPPETLRHWDLVMFGQVSSANLSRQ